MSELSKNKSEKYTKEQVPKQQTRKVHRNRSSTQIPLLTPTQISHKKNI